MCNKAQPSYNFWPHCCLRGRCQTSLTCAGALTALANWDATREYLRPQMWHGGIPGPSSAKGWMYSSPCPRPILQEWPEVLRIVQTRCLWVYNMSKVCRSARLVQKLAAPVVKKAQIDQPVLSLRPTRRRARGAPASHEQLHHHVQWSAPTSRHRGPHYTLRPPWQICTSDRCGDEWASWPWDWRAANSDCWGWCVTAWCQSSVLQCFHVISLSHVIYNL